MSRTRRMIVDLTPPALDDGDLPAALAALRAREEGGGTAAQVRFRTAANGAGCRRR